MTQPRLTVRECGISTARMGVARLHRHLPRVRGGLLAFEAIGPDGWPVGWAIVGRPPSRVLQARGFVEVTRCATDGTPNACSALYGAAARWARKRGKPVITYTLASESGASLRGAGWLLVGHTRGGQWSCASRARSTRSAALAAPKQRWMPPYCAESAP